MDSKAIWYPWITIIFVDGKLNNRYKELFYYFKTLI